MGIMERRGEDIVGNISLKNMGENRTFQIRYVFAVAAIVMWCNGSIIHKGTYHNVS